MKKKSENFTRLPSFGKDTIMKAGEEGNYFCGNNSLT